MRRSNRFSLGLVTLLLAALACNLPQNQAQATPEVNAAFTAAAQTVSAQLTQSALTLNAPTVTGIAPPPTTTPTNTTTAPTIAPPPTNPPTIPPTLTQICDRAKFVSDVSVPDGTIMAKGQLFTKTWRIQNIGTCSWTPSYTIVFDHGDQMSGPSAQALGGNVNPGQTIDISVNLTAPSTNNHYVGYWKLRNASGVTFTQFYADIKVQGGGGGSGGIFAVTSVTYTLSTWNDAGHTNCPRVIAHITTNGPGTITYKWTSSSGTNPYETLIFGAAGTQSINYDWARGSVWAGTPAWIGIYVDDPNHQDFGHKNFTTACTSP
jgi:hypothetical protein